MPVKELKDMTIAELVVVYNRHSNKKIKTFRSKAEAVRRTKTVMSAGKPQKDGTNTKGTGGAKSGGRSKNADTDTIHINTDVNPKRKGTTAHATFARYREGMTIAAAIKAGIPRADIRWDSKKRFIIIKKAK